MPAGIVMGGIMRGFQQKRLRDGTPSIDKIAYISCLSGGNFPAIVYKYAKNTTSSLILDADGISDPSEITKEELENIPETSVFSRFAYPTYVGHGSIAYLKSVYFKEDFFTTFMSSIFLDSFGIGINDCSTNLFPSRKDAKPTVISMASMLGPKELFPGHLKNLNRQLSVDVSEALEDSFMEVPSTPDLADLVVPNTDFMWKLAEKSYFQIPVGAYMTLDEFVIPMSKHQMKFDPVVDSADNMTKIAEPINSNQCPRTQMNYSLHQKVCLLLQRCWV